MITRFANFSVRDHSLSGEIFQIYLGLDAASEPLYRNVIKYLSYRRNLCIFYSTILMSTCIFSLQAILKDARLDCWLVHAKDLLVSMVKLMM